MSQVVDLRQKLHRQETSMPQVEDLRQKLQNFFCTTCNLDFSFLQSRTLHFQSNRHIAAVQGSRPGRHDYACFLCWGGFDDSKQFERHCWGEMHQSWMQTYGVAGFHTDSVTSKREPPETNNVARQEGFRRDMPEKIRWDSSHKRKVEVIQRDYQQLNNNVQFKNKGNDVPEDDVNLTWSPSPTDKESEESFEDESVSSEVEVVWDNYVVLDEMGPSDDEKNNDSKLSKRKKKRKRKQGKDEEVESLEKKRQKIEWDNGSESMNNQKSDESTKENRKEKQKETLKAKEHKKKKKKGKDARARDRTTMALIIKELSAEYKNLLDNKDEALNESTSMINECLKEGFIHPSKMLAYPKLRDRIEKRINVPIEDSLLRNLINKTDEKIKMLQTEPKVQSKDSEVGKKKKKQKRKRKKRAEMSEKERERIRKKDKEKEARNRKIMAQIMKELNGENRDPFPGSNNDVEPKPEKGESNVGKRKFIHPSVILSDPELRARIEKNMGAPIKDGLLHNLIKRTDRQRFRRDEKRKEERKKLSETDASSSQVISSDKEVKEADEAKGAHEAEEVHEAEEADELDKEEKADEAEEAHEAEEADEFDEVAGDIEEE